MWCGARTYLAIRYAVETIPPLLVVGIRQETGRGRQFSPGVYARGYRPTLPEWRAPSITYFPEFSIS